jgi:predicted RNA-binding Zn-ribbon protein involved in translation (DUF1610 family)
MGIGKRDTDYCLARKNSLPSLYLQETYRGGQVMADFITLSCPSCGHKLQITSDIDRFACAACGNEHIVNRSGGIATLKPVIEGIEKVQVGVDKTASELAIVRLKKEIDDLEGKIQAINYPKLSSDDLVIIMVCLSLVGFILLFIHSTRVISVFLVICIFLVYILQWRGAKRRKEMLDDEARVLRNKLDTKKRELAVHQQTVSTFK